MKEDVAEIIMNIKNLAIRNNSSTNDPKVAYIEFEGEGVVTAADIQVDSDIEIVNPELEIASERRRGLQALHGADHHEWQRIHQFR